MTRQRRLCQLGFSAGLVTMVLGALMAIAPVAGANEHPQGNNGTVKIDGLHALDGPGHGPGPNDPGQHPDNDPHVLCAFELEFFGFDTGQTANIVFTSHAPTTGQPDPLLAEMKVISDDSAGDVDGENPDRDAVLAYDLSEQLRTIEPHPVHGWHVKLALTLYDAVGKAVPGGKKHKVFWVEGCVPEMGISLVKTNDADRNEDFTDSEEAPARGSDVTFRLDITNTGDTELTIQSLEDRWSGQEESLDLLQDELDCSRDGTTVDITDPLPAGSTTTCYFAVPDYAPPASSPLENTVTVITGEGPSAEDTSTVTSPVLTYSVELTKENDANGNADFSDSEQAPSAGVAVPFQIVIANTGTGDLTLERITDRWGESEQIELLRGDVVLDCHRGEGEESENVVLSVGAVLPAGSTTTCTFTIDEYAPAAGDSVVNTVTVVTDEGPQGHDTSAVSTPPENPTFSVDVEKRNDANGDGTFSEPEQAPTAGAPVAFEVRIQNIGTGHLTLASLVDTWTGHNLDLLDPSTGLSCTRGDGTVPLEVGSVLPAGSITVCTFTVAGYAPGPGGSITNTVAIGTDEASPDEDDSTVTGPPTQTVSPTASYSVAIEKLNDADGDGDFSVEETADDAGDDVRFQVAIENAGTGALVLRSLTDQVPGRGTIDLLGDDIDLRCTSGVADLRVGSVLPAGSTTVCTFVLDDYAPGAGESLTNTVTIVTDRDGDVDTSTVETGEEIVVLPAPPVVNQPTQGTPPPPPPAPSVLGPTVETPPMQVVGRVPAPEVRGDVVRRALPRTGDDARGLTGTGAFLLAVGAAMVLGSRRQLARR